MTAADVRGSDPGDGRIATPSAVRVPSSADPVSGGASALPPPAPDRGHPGPDWSEVVGYFREGLVVCDADGVVRHLSPVAERLLPEVAAGRPLAAAGIPALTDAATDGFGHHDRRLRIRRMRLAGSGGCLYVEDVTDSASRADALLAERARSAVLDRDQAEVADTLQASLLPVEPATAPGVQWGTAYRPAQAALRIGGDFYGAYRLADGGSVFFLGDVSGKGVAAAVFTGQLRQCLQALHRVESNPGRLVQLLNDALLETTPADGQGRFATMVLGVVRPQRDGGLSLTMAGGGHLPPLVLRNSGDVETVPLRGMLLGVVSDPRISEVTVRLAAGETCLLYSDGVTEARGGRCGDEQFGQDRLVDAVSACHRVPAPALAERVEQVTCDWLAHGDHDDIAVLALRATGPGGRPPRHLHAVPAMGRSAEGSGVPVVTGPRARR
ncbi:PP2C family protein-serine/threonine phosphatase [Micromonospora sp. NPDC092111]|uniref:PP2C family protein-serine/threonine phosphatase n=1 Tax=Micromonospora sp. NPDC092111 TaxID=3364289 RepID=UPI00380AE826